MIYLEIVRKKWNNKHYIITIFRVIGAIAVKEVNTIPVLAVLREYIVLAIKSVSVLFQNILEKISGYTSLHRPIPVGIGASTSKIKTIEKYY